MTAWQSRDAKRIRCRRFDWFVWWLVIMALVIVPGIIGRVVE